METEEEMGSEALWRLDGEEMAMLWNGFDNHGTLCLSLPCICCLACFFLFFLLASYVSSMPCMLDMFAYDEIFLRPWLPYSILP